MLSYEVDTCPNLHIFCWGVPIPVPITVLCTVRFRENIYSFTGSAHEQDGDCQDQGMVECGKLHPRRCREFLGVDCSADISVEVLDELIGLFPGCDLPGNLIQIREACEITVRQRWEGPPVCSDAIACDQSEGCP
ncbi:MAG: hypothetical protein GEEBNDBF_01368 [bacterium]|nr:hypothetical protein [bacterium]